MSIDRDFIKNELLKLNVINEDKLDEYIDFCLSRDVGERVKGKTSHHHILPKAKGLPHTKYSNLMENPWNGVHLSHADHYHSHYLLHEAVNEYLVSYAFTSMHNRNEKLGIISEDVVVSAEQYAKSREKFSLLMSQRQNEIMECGLTRSQVNAKKQWETKRKNGNIGDASQMHTPEAREKWMTKMNEIQENGLTKSQNSALHMVSVRRDYDGENNPFFGKTHSEETKEKMRIAKKGFIPWNKGKTLTEEQKAKMGGPHTEEAKEKMRIAKKGKKQRTTPCTLCGRDVSISSIKRHEVACAKKKSL